MLVFGISWGWIDRGWFMGTLRVLFCAAAFVVAALAEAAAANDKGLPTLDLQTRCKKSEAAMIDMMGAEDVKGSAFDLCVKSEQAARDALQAAWADIPPSYKSFCVRPGDYSASYIEWIACVEMLIDAKKMRPAVSADTGDVPKRCPMISYAADGSIKSVQACAQSGRRMSQ